jgi:ABC-type multidrug transport system ATPase subunit
VKALIVDDLIVSYGDFVAVQGARFGVEAGQVFRLLGPNGAGKTGGDLRAISRTRRTARRLG